MVGKNAMICDRRIYTYKGKWKSPQDDIEKPIFYFISSPQTLVESYENGRETMKPTIEITVFGEHPIAQRDIVKLQNGETYRVGNITLNYIEHNILVRDMLKQRIESMTLTLE